MKRAFLTVVVVLVLLSVMITACSSGSIAGEYSQGVYILKITDNVNFYVREAITNDLYRQGVWEKRGDNLYFNFTVTWNMGNENEEVNVTVSAETEEGDIIVYSGMGIEHKDLILQGRWEKDK